MEQDPMAAPVATAELPALRRVLAVKQIDREIGSPIAPGQIVQMLAAVADQAIKDGLAKDPDAKPEPQRTAAKSKD